MGAGSATNWAVTSRRVWTTRTSHEASQTHIYVWVRVPVGDGLDGDVRPGHLRLLLIVY